MSAQPRVSIVTPYYNTAPYLAACIESVLAQTHENFEYWLVDNHSTDGSEAIAARYAARDGRIRLGRPPAFLPQVPNFNAALRRIDPAARYVKMVLADDTIAPGCVARMVEVAESHPGVGLVAAYYVYEDRIDGAGVPYGQAAVGGREALRLMLGAGRFITGTPSTVLYRADIVRARDPFFTPGLYHVDTEAAYGILLAHDLGFVHEVLSFVRTDNEGVTSSRRGFHPEALDFLIAVERYGPQVLDEAELAFVREGARRSYYGLLGRMALRLPGRRFWEYHRSGLATVGRPLRWRDVLPWAAAEVAHVVLNPENSFRRVLRRSWRRRASALSAAILEGVRRSLPGGGGGLEGRAGPAPQEDGGAPVLPPAPGSSGARSSQHSRQ